MEPWIISCLVVMALGILFSKHFLETSVAMRENDAEGTAQGPAFIEFLKGAGCAGIAVIACAVMLATTGWVAIVMGGVVGAALFLGALSVARERLMGPGERVVLLVGVMLMVAAVLGALGRGAT